MKKWRNRGTHKNYWSHWVKPDRSAFPRGLNWYYLCVCLHPLDLHNDFVLKHGTREITVDFYPCAEARGRHSRVKVFFIVLAKIFTSSQRLAVNAIRNCRILRTTTMKNLVSILIVYSILTFINRYNTWAFLLRWSFLTHNTRIATNNV